MKSSEYWQKRFTAVENMNHNAAKRAVQSVTPAFDKAQQQIEGEINAWYQRYANNNQISLQEAKIQLNAKELKELKWDIDDYIKAGKENAVDQKWLKELENASAKYHISRLEALKIRTQQAAEVAFGNETDVLDELAARIYTDDYYHTAYEIQKGLGIGWAIGQIDQDKLSKLLKKPWTTDNMTFSDRIWKSKAQLVESVQTELTQMCILGKAPDEAIANLAKRMNVSKNQAGRLIMTESAYFSSEARKDCFNELDVEQYEVVATLDAKTSEICQQMDGKVFDMKDYKAGVTANPFHVNCRSTTVPYFDDEFTVGETRAARDVITGETYQVPADMKYSEWKETQNKKYGEGTVEKYQKIAHNESADKSQFERYKELLGNKAPKTFKDFQQIKYSDAYASLKTQYADARIQERIKTNKISTEVLTGKQGKHIKGNNNYIEGRSYLNFDTDIQSLVNKCAGTGTILRDSSGKWSHKEVVVADHPIGFAVSLIDGSVSETSTFTIHYSKKGVHIVPKKE